MLHSETPKTDLIHYLLVDLCKATAHPLVDRKKLLDDISKTLIDYKAQSITPVQLDEFILTSRVHEYLWNQFTSGKLEKTDDNELPTQAFIKLYRRMRNNIFNTNERVALLQFLFNLAGKQLNFPKTETQTASSECPKALKIPLINDQLNCLKVTNHATDAAIAAFCGQFKGFKNNDLSLAELSTNGTFVLNGEYKGIFSRLTDICENYNFLLTFTVPEGPFDGKGLIGRSLTYCLKLQLKKYEEAVKILEKHFNHKKSLGFHNQLTLTELICLTTEPWTHLKWLVIIIEKCAKKSITHALFDMFPNGSRIATNYVSMFLVSISAPLYKMMTSWMFESIIFDPYHEFFIEQKTNTHILHSWYDKYTICYDKLPPFISLELAEKILIIGKSFEMLLDTTSFGMNTIWGQREFQLCFEENPDYILRRNANTELHMILDHIHLRISAQIIKMFSIEHKLFAHLYGMRHYSLLGHSSFIEYVIDSLYQELDKPALIFYDFDIFSEVDRCIGITNIHKKDKDIRYCMDCNLLLPSMGNTGWDIFFLQYIVHGSLNDILKPFAKICEKLFRPLWRLKHTEFILRSSIWRNQRFFGRKLHFIFIEFNDILRILQSTTVIMMHFIQELAYYVFFEVLECAWRKFEYVHTKTAKSIDDILHAYQQFLDTVQRGIFLDTDKIDYVQIIDKIYTLIMSLEKWQNIFFDCCSFEFIAREYFENYLKIKDNDNSTKIEEYVVDERFNSKTDFYNAIDRQSELLVKIAEDFKQEAIKFINLISESSDPNLLSFALRLNFNEFYFKE